MPTVLRIGPFRFYFYSHEPNEPPHVHVDRAGCSLKVWLDDGGMARNVGFRRHEINAIMLLVQQNRARLLEAWDEHFGPDRG